MDTKISHMVVPLVALSLATNLAVFISPLFMMQVLDKVVPSQNLNTLLLFLTVAIFAIFMNAAIEYFRRLALTKIGYGMEAQAFASIQANEDKRNSEIAASAGMIPMFLERHAIAVFDLPWIPLFLLFLFVLHPAFLLVAVVFTAIWIGLKSLEYLRSTRNTERLSDKRARFQMFSRALTGPAVKDFSFKSGIIAHFKSAYQDTQNETLSQSLTDAGEQEIKKFLRAVLQVTNLSIGALLVANGTLTAGGMIAATLISTKFIQVFEGALGSLLPLKDFLQTRKTLQAAIDTAPSIETKIQDLSGRITAKNLTLPRGLGAPPVLDRVSFELPAGEILAVLGASGCGKTALLRALAGVDHVPIGGTFFDDTEVSTIDAETYAATTAFVGQFSSTLPGTIADNITSFDPNRRDEDLLNAARATGLHAEISLLENSYDTVISEADTVLTNSQIQRLAISRALYNAPKYLFLDEPNSLLDHRNERRLASLFRKLKKTGTTVVFSAHRMGIVNLADKILVLDEGRVADFGPRSEILGRMMNQHRRISLSKDLQSIDELVDWMSDQFVRDSDAAFCDRATEIVKGLFHFSLEAVEAAPTDKLDFEFKFIDDHTCQITMTDGFDARIEQKVKKLSNSVRKDKSGQSALSDDELRLAAAIDLSAGLQHKRVDSSYEISASVTDNFASEERVYQ